MTVFVVGSVDGAVDVVLSVSVRFVSACLQDASECLVHVYCLS